jgi:hypothetical protein
MRLILRAGLALGLVAGACKDSAGPGDFSDPVAVTTDLQAVDSAFDTDVYRSFAVASADLGPAVTGAASLQPTAGLLSGTFPKLDRSAASPSILGALQAERLRELRPQMSVAAAQGRIIPDSVYGRVFQWDAALDQYTWQNATVGGLNGVRFILYRVDVNGIVVEPVVEVGYADLIDESTLSTLQLHIGVKGVGGTTTYLDYTATIAATATTLNANASGFITNGLTAGANKTLTFDEAFSVTDTRVTANATFTLNNPVRTLTMSESVTLSGQSIIISADFRIIRPSETVQFTGRVTLTYNDVTQQFDITVNAAVRVNGQTVATISGDPATAQWVDAGGEPLTADDLDALAGLEDAAQQFQETVNSLFLPIQTFFGG